VKRGEVEELERFYGAFNAGRPEAMLAFAHPDFVYRTREELPGGGSFDGETAIERIAQLRELFDEVRWEPQEFIDAGGRALVVVRQIARGRASGVEVDEPVVHVWSFHDGMAIELRVFSDRGEALAALGASE
jgi:ketosteroid isomerase-like protein